MLAGLEVFVSPGQRPVAGGGGEDQRRVLRQLADAGERDPARETGDSGEAPTKHFENFIKAVRSRKTEDQNGPVETAHYAAGLAHLGNIAFHRGKVLEFDPRTQELTNDKQANALLGKKYRKGFEVPSPDKV